MKNHAAFFFFAAWLILPAVPAGSQIYSASSCEKMENPGLAAEIRSGKIAKLSWWENYHLGLYVCEWSTSFLKSSGRAPKKPENLESLPDWESRASDFEMAFEQWSCMYSAWSAMDGSPKTAWCEGKKDNGIGEVLMVKVDTAKPVKIWAGLGASPGLHKQNSRPKKVRVYVLQASKGYKNIGQYAIGFEYRDIAVLGSVEVTLRDLNGYQPLPLPKHRPRDRIENPEAEGPEPVTAADSTIVAIEILSVYPGTKYTDTCISEVGN